MTGFLAILAVAVVGGLIQRGRRPDEARWRYTRVWMLVVTLAIPIVGGVVVLSRGWSKSSAAMIGVGFVLTGSAMCLLFEGQLAQPAVDDDGWLWGALRSTKSSFRRRWLCIGWGLLSLCYLLAALQFGGAFVREPALERISAVAALGQFKSLQAQRPIDTWQCLEARDIRSHNQVGDCSLPHRSEVVEEIDTDKNCRSVGSYTETGIDLKVVEVGPFDGSRFCVLQSKSPLLTWTGRVHPPEIASTT